MKYGMILLLLSLVFGQANAYGGSLQSDELSEIIWSECFIEIEEPYFDVNFLDRCPVELPVVVEATKASANEPLPEIDETQMPELGLAIASFVHPELE